MFDSGMKWREFDAFLLSVGKRRAISTSKFCPL